MLSTEFEMLVSDLDNFDLVVVGDGSGTVREKPCGWCAFSYEVATKTAKRHVGGVSGGTNNVAELSPYLFVLNDWAEKAMPGTRILIVSDSEVTVRCGSGQYERKANRGLWASVAWFEKWFEITWRWVPRNSNPVSERADALAGEARGVLTKLCERLDAAGTV